MQSVKFSIRDIMLVTVILALAVVWWVDRTALRERVEKLEQSDSIDAPTIHELQIDDTFKFLPNSQAPAPNPPNP